MSWKRSCLEAAVWGWSRLSGGAGDFPERPESILVLRNNDIGDLLVITPLFEALRTLFPAARIVAGVGDWNRPVLERNPHLSSVVSVNAPWHNRFVRPQGLSVALEYLLSSREVRELAAQRFEVGLDILGSPFGSMLMLRSGIRHRLGVKGYAGGHSAAQRSVTFCGEEYVGRMSLRFAELLGASTLPPLRPQLFLSQAEQEVAEATWKTFEGKRPRKGRRIVLGPGGGYQAKCWPLDEWNNLARLLAQITGDTVLVVGGKKETPAGEFLERVNPQVKNLAGQVGLRQTFGLVAKSDLVLCNSSMLMHVAAAFARPALVLLGDCFPSASAHAAQWASGPQIQVLGKDGLRSSIFAAVEVFEVIQRERLGLLAA